MAAWNFVEKNYKKLVVHHQKYRVIVEPTHVRLLCIDHHNQLHRFCPPNDRDLPRFTNDFIKLMKAEHNH